MNLLLTLLVLATGTFVLSYAFQVLLFHRSFASSRGWMRIITHNFGVSGVVALAIALTLADQGDFSKYWFLPLYVLAGRILGDFPLIVVQEQKRRQDEEFNHDVLRKFNGY